MTTLVLHPTSRCGAAITVEVQARRPEPGLLELAYAVRGAVGALYVPPPAEPLRTDELWRRTCFEAFLRPGAGEAYVELNFAPSSRWAAYRFTGYREGMAPPRDRRAARSRSPRDAERARARRRSSTSPRHLPPGPCRLALSAVIEETNGDRILLGAGAPARPARFPPRGGFACAPSRQ